METHRGEDFLEQMQFKQANTDDYSPMHPSDNPLIALAEQLGYRISSLGCEAPSGHHVQRYRGESATATIYENDLLKLVFQLIEYTQSGRPPVNTMKQSKREIAR